jgi:Tfp pilus assembly pilus retraction ATPase PilT
MTDSILSKILDKAMKLGASDIHLSEDSSIIFRVHGELDSF